MTVPVARTDTGVKRVLLVTLIVKTRVIKTQVFASVRTVILTPKRIQPFVQHVPQIATTKHAIPILVCVIKVAWMVTGEMTAIARAAKNVLLHVSKKMDIAYSVQIHPCMVFLAI